MALPSIGSPIKFSQVNTELGLTSTAKLNMNSTIMRVLFGNLVDKSITKMSQGRGKSARAKINLTIDTTRQNYSVYNSAISTGAYVAGKSDIVVTINSGIYVGSYSVSEPAMTVEDTFTSGDTITINNNGTISGAGGFGGVGGDITYYLQFIGFNTIFESFSATNGGNGQSGGTALRVLFATTVNNGSVITGGGGGGGGGGGFGGNRAVNPGVKNTPYQPFLNSGPGGGGGAGYLRGDRGVAGFINTNTESGVYQYGATNGANGSMLNGGASGNYFGADGYSGSGGSGGGGSQGSNGTAGITPGDSGAGLAMTVFYKSEGLITASGGAGGPAGSYIVGNNNVTWAVTGTRYGNIIS